LTHTSEVNPAEDNLTQIKKLKRKLKEQDLAELFHGGSATPSGNNDVDSKDDESDDVGISYILLLSFKSVAMNISQCLKQIVVGLVKNHIS
jgi:hypothetical protein